jgi:Tfp pilus assembly protein PilF
MIWTLIPILIAVFVGLLVDWRGILRPKSREEVLEPVVHSESLQVRRNVFSPEVQKLLTDAGVAFEKGEYTRAEELYVKAAAADPRCSPAYARLGVIYLENDGDADDAAEALRHALSIEPENGVYLNNLGRVYYHQERFTDAIRCFESAVRQKETSASRNANLGKAYLAIRQYAKAESSFKKAVKYAPQTHEYRDLLEEALEKKLAHRQLIRR